jgi:opacity protein-like surface antigen
MMGRVFITATLAAGLLACASVAAWADEDLSTQSQWYLPSAAEPEAPLRLPRVTSSAAHFGATIETENSGDYWVGGSLSLGEWSDRENLPIGDPASQSVLASGYLALSDGIWGVTPYVGAGVGASPTSTPTLGQMDSSWSLAYQGVAGFAVNWTPMLSTEIEYRYFATSDELAVAPGPGADQAYQSHDVMLRIDLGF